MVLASFVHCIQERIISKTKTNIQIYATLQKRLFEYKLENVKILGKLIRNFLDNVRKIFNINEELFECTLLFPSHVWLQQNKRLVKLYINSTSFILHIHFTPPNISLSLSRQKSAMGLKNFILAISLTIAITIIVSTSTIFVSNNETETHMQMQTHTFITKKPPRVSRFLAQNAKNGRNANAVDHCNENEEICKSQGTYNSTMACCSNNCIDVAYDNDNCGACKNQCMFTQTCCGGECVYLDYDKRHCGECNHKCLGGEFCVYGLCNYA